MVKWTCLAIILYFALKDMCTASFVEAGALVFKYLLKIMITLHSLTRNPTIGSTGSSGIARNFDWERPNVEKSCDVSLVTFFGDSIMMMLK